MVRGRLRLALPASAVAALAAVGLLAGPAAAGSPSPAPRTPVPVASPDYNARLGTSRQAAAAAAAAGRRLYGQAGFWEVFVRTDPAVLPHVDPTRPSLASSPAAGVSKVTLIMATESSLALNQFREGGHQHEQAVVAAMAQDLAGRFPGASVECDIYFGESHLHARATLVRGALQYTVLDTL